ncbi:cysteine desulfurase family protein [Halomicrococcus sp. NG-SE-24]|uniref:cysteine desulfurase family protein n=1 Tax=Halomicrococcus sp. NG-SE-24 TaxID=3436928 RepID=UPI003D961C5E
MTSDESDGIYFDHHATTPVDDRVVDAMAPVFTEDYGNPASNNNHRAGDTAKRHVKQAREQLVSTFNANRIEEIIFTSGATESNNLALKGVMRYAREQGYGNHLITGATEHDAVIDTAAALEDEDFEVTILPVDKYGRIDSDDVRDTIRDETVLVSLMAANNEVGTITPIAEIGHITSEADVLFHTDAVQAVGYLDIDVEEMEIDLMSISGHKIYGPKGVGGLYVRYGATHIHPLVHGGGHERGWRSGTLNVPGIVGLAKAVELADENRESRTAHVEQLRDRFWEQLDECLDNIAVNGHPDRRLPNNLNVSFLGVDNQRLVGRLSDSGLYAATGSACSTMETTESHVLTAMLEDDERIQSSIRFGLGKDNTTQEVDEAVEIVTENVDRLRKFNSMT